MDNVCHTLVGAALAEAGLKRRTALGAATLMIAANFPDIDVIAVPLGHSLGFRRGITHGVPALIVLPLVLTFIMLGWHRWRRKGGDSAHTRQLLLLSAIGILTHPFLDWMNTYGMRWLMPLSGTWWYADTLFIIDPWIWLALGLGVWLSRRRLSTRPSRIALAGVAVYIAGMGALSVRAKAAVEEKFVARGLRVDQLVVDPVFANPFRKRVIVRANDAYSFADYDILTDNLGDESWHIPVNEQHPEISAANATAAGREYHSWTRLPYYVIEPAADTTWVTIADARYTLDGRSSWAAVRIPVPRH